ncbi:MAG: hypothetical protein QM723_40295 [Myxococcaceae bacterium]
MATTQLAYATSERDTYKTMLAAANAALAGAQAAAAAAAQKLNDTASALNDKQAAIATTRNQLEVAETSADTATLLALLETQTAQLHVLQGDAARYTFDAKAADARSKFWTTRVSALSPLAASAETALTAAQADDQKRTALKTLANGAAIAAVVTEADDVATNSGTTLQQDAEAKLTDSTKDHVPAELFDAAKARFALLWARAKAAATVAGASQSAVSAQQKADLHLLGDERDAWVAFKQAESLLGDFVSTAPQRLARAKQLLTDLQGLTGQAISKAESDKAALGLSSGLVSAAVLTGLSDIVTAQGDLDTAQAAYDAAFQAARAKDPSLSDAQVDADGTVGPLKTTRDAKKTALDGKRAGVAQADLDKAHQWFLSLKDSTWQRLRSLFEAEALLKDLAAATPSAWATDLTNKEGAWGDAATALADSNRSVDYLTASVSRAAGLSQAQAEALDRQLSSAVRGDILFER